MKKKHIVFDFDGTIFNSNQVILESWQEVYRYYTGKEADEAVIYRTFGETLRYSLSKAFPQANPDEAVQIYREFQEAHYKEMTGLFDGVREMMDQLRSTGHTLSIATSRVKATTLEYLEMLGLSNYFDALVTCDDTDKHKPDPTPLLMVLDKLRARREDSIMLGDTKFDIGCCNNAGVDSILVGWSHEVDEAEMQAMGFSPTYRVKTPAEVLLLV